MNPGLRSVVCGLVLLAGLARPQAASARVRLESICSVYGQKPVRLTGVGLIIGLDGTGDGKNAEPTVQALSRALDLMGNPIANAALRDANNVAIVMLEAEIPATSVRAGQRIDVVCSSVMQAASLRGGRLLSAPLQLADRRSKALVATAAGPLSVEDAEAPTTARISGGAIIQTDLFEERHFLSEVIKQTENGPTFTLLLNPNHASFISARSVVDSINADFRDVNYGVDIARAAGPGMIEIGIPEAYRTNPVEYIAEVLDIGVDRPHTTARVVVNTRSNTVIVTGEAEISPVVISHPGLALEIGPGFRALTDPQAVTNQVQLKQLMGALSQLRVSTPDIVAIVRELNATGKLHAIYEER